MPNVPVKFTANQYAILGQIKAAGAFQPEVSSAVLLDDWINDQCLNWMKGPIRDWRQGQSDAAIAAVAGKLSLVDAATLAQVDAILTAKIG